MTGRKRSIHHKLMEQNPRARTVFDAYKREMQKKVAGGERVYCDICGRVIPRNHVNGQDNRNALSIDHLRPYRDDDPSTWDRSNLRPTHRSCNRRKGRAGPGVAPLTPPSEEYSRW